MQHLQSATFLLGVLACMLPIVGGAFVWVYAMHTPGSHWSYVGVGTLTAMAALLVGILVGFILGVPKLVSSGQVKVPDGSTSPNTNLGDISDWLTKLLLGAGLVSLGRLGGPIGRLIDNVATGLRTSAVNASVVATSKVAAGAILIAFAILGVLEGYVVTSVWYPAKLERLAAAANKLHANPPPATQPAGVTGPAGPSAAAAAANGGTAAPSVAVVASTGGPTRQSAAPATEDPKG